MPLNSLFDYMVHLIQMYVEGGITFEVIAKGGKENKNGAGTPTQRTACQATFSEVSIDWTPNT